MSDPRDNPFDDDDNDVEDDDDDDEEGDDDEGDDDDDDDDDRLMVDAEEEEENDEDDGEEEVEEENEATGKPHIEMNPAKKGRKPRGSLLTGRGVTMQMLIDDNILEAGEKLLSIDYLV